MRFCVEATDDSLQLGEFPNHVGDQVAFDKFRGTVGRAYAGMRECRWQTTARRASGPVRACARPFRRSFRAFPGRLPPPVSEDSRRADISGPSPRKIARPQTARATRARARRESVRPVLVQIDDRQEIRRQRAVLALQREVFLVVTHHGDQNLIRQFQIRRVKSAQDCRRDIRSDRSPYP